MSKKYCQKWEVWRKDKKRGWPYRGRLPKEGVVQTLCKLWYEEQQKIDFNFLSQIYKLFHGLYT